MMENIRKTRKLPEQVADKLREMIIQEEFRTGTKLPAEAELMARFGVSRSTVREAVKILQTEHIVDIRQGQGTFLCAMPGLAKDPLGLRFADQNELTAQLLETRLIIEPNVAALAAQRRTEEQLAAMKVLLDKMDNAYLHGEDYTPYDIEFHSIIAKCTGNDVVQRLLPTIHESIQAGYRHTQRVEGSYQRASQCHMEMYRGIMEHDSERARMAAQRHMMQTMHDSGIEVPSVLIK
ncbi:MAG: FadR family transcriptional regulator [Clostridia bacterium]|nr:FadR family transcriptional regulator [Clostridia bacterium]